MKKVTLSRLTLDKRLLSSHRRFIDPVRSPVPGSGSLGSPHRVGVLRLTNRSSACSKFEMLIFRRIIRINCWAPNVGGTGGMSIPKKNLGATYLGAEAAHRFAGSGRAWLESAGSCLLPRLCLRTFSLDSFGLAQLISWVRVPFRVLFWIWINADAAW